MKLLLCILAILLNKLHQENCLLILVTLTQKLLLSSIPSIDPDDQKKAIELKGEIPSAMNPPSGCVFRTRCPNPTHECKEGHTEMGLIEVSPNHWVDQCCINCG